MKSANNQRIIIGESMAYNEDDFACKAEEFRNTVYLPEEKL